jgi:hypothetical protein
MTAKELVQDAKKLKDRAILVVENDHEDSLNAAWLDLNELYGKADQVFQGRAVLSLHAAEKNWESIRKYARYVERACEDFGSSDADEEALAGT